jgi:hypothetical protein
VGASVEYANCGILPAKPESVLSGRTVEQVAAEGR